MKMAWENFLRQALGLLCCRKGDERKLTADGGGFAATRGAGDRGCETFVIASCALLIHH